MLTIFKNFDMLNNFRYKSVDNQLYTKDVAKKYIRMANMQSQPPHPYALADRALLASQNTSIIISGESGAGKTESVKIMIGFVAGRNGRAGAARSAAYS